MNIQRTIERKLRRAFSLLHLEVVNESHKHNLPDSLETHFKVTMVSAEFAGKTLLALHQLAYKILSQEIQAGVHALALHMLTEQEWQKKNAEVRR